MKIRWHIQDIIDLEYFIHGDNPDGASASSGIERRDRNIYLERIVPLLEDGEASSRRTVIRHWLEARRQTEKEGSQTAILPGETFTEIHRLLCWIFILLGGMSGSGLAAALLRYTGTEPVNVSLYIAALVLCQIALILTVAGLLLIRGLNSSFFGGSALCSLLGRILTSLMARVRQKGAAAVPGHHRAGLEAVLGLIRGRRMIYGTLFFWPFFTLAQIFGIGFNTGAICTTLVRVMGTDLAFGWQSTLQLSAPAVYRLVHTIALPWSWALPEGIAHPTLAQIVGSRMILKDGLYYLATENLTAWWPFLVLAVCVYGLVPRIILLMTGLIARRHILDRADFSHSDADRLMHRLQTPQVTTEGGPSAPRIPEPAEIPSAPLPDETDVNPGQADALIVLIPDDIFDLCPEDRINALISGMTGFAVREKIRLGQDYKADRQILEKLKQTDWAGGRPGVFILQEAWQPPIREMLAFIRDLRQVLGERARIAVGLIGRPVPDTIFTSVKTENWNIWRQKISSMGDPYLRLERLVKNHES